MRLTGARCRARPWRPASSEAGSGALLVLLASGLVLFTGAFLSLLAAVAVARHRAASAADLAALAAQAHAHEGQARACRAAAAVLRPAQAQLNACTLTNGVADVWASVRPSGLVGRLGTATSRARAGPDVGSDVGYPRGKAQGRRAELPKDRDQAAREPPRVPARQHHSAPLLLGRSGPGDARTWPLGQAGSTGAASPGNA